MPQATLSAPTYASVSRNLDVATSARIAATRELPPEWKESPLLVLAHRLYWEEQSSAARSSGVGQEGGIFHHSV